MAYTDKKLGEEKFNDTLKRMLETPPKPHGDGATSKKTVVGKHPGKKPGGKQSSRPGSPLTNP